MIVSWAQRGEMLPVTRRVRAYFAPVQRATSAPAVFDPAKNPYMLLDAPPPPWIDAGEAVNLERKAGTQLKTIRSGSRDAAQKQFRTDLDASVEFDFLQWGKLQLALSSGSQQMNLLAETFGTPDAASGGTPAGAVGLAPGSTSNELVVGAGNVAAFLAGDLVAVDNDYQQQTGYVGAGISGAFVKNAADVHGDGHYIRRVTFNVGRVLGTTPTTVVLSQNLLGGTPTPTMGVQKIMGFVDREGGSFVQEWSALFVYEGESGARIYFHYPRVQPAQPAAEKRFAISDGFEGLSLHCALRALPATDSNDSETVVCYRSYVPAPYTAVY